MNKYTLLAGVGAVALGFASPAMAGNIVLTGHDNDFHETFGSSNSDAAMAAELSFIRNGSSLPVLVIDQASEAIGVVSSIIGAGNVVARSPFSGGSSPVVGAADFDHSKYSAFVVASVTSCGGCDNPPGTGTQLATFESSIQTFFNAGGGILGLAGASDPSAYAYVPESATNPGGSPPRTGYVTTADGTSLGIPAVNGDTTHNFFNEPGTGGLSPLYKVTERLRDPISGTPETIALKGGEIVCTGPDCVIHGAPEPMTLSLLGAGLFGLGMARRRWSK